MRGDIAAPSGRGGILIAAHTPASSNPEMPRATLFKTMTNVDEFTAGSVDVVLINELNRYFLRNNPALKALREQARNGVAATLGVVQR